MPSRIGEKFGSYELIQFLGRGGFAEVYLGKHTQLPQQMAAIKILDKQLIIAKSQQFQKEASILVTFRHPNIVQMYDYNVYSNPELTRTLVPYIIMEYAPNKSLRVKHQRGLALPMRTIITYTKQIADALQYAHDQGVMHLDVKPENILINAQLKLLLSDFGLATLLTEEEKTGDIQGTLSYMSPEHLEGRPGFASDQYALGVMAYEWVCGHLPFAGQSVNEVITKHLKASPPSLRAQITTLPPRAEEVIFQSLEKNAAHRFASIEAFAEALDQATSTLRSKAPAATPLPNTNVAQPSPLLPGANPPSPLPVAQASVSPAPGANPGAASLPNAHPFPPPAAHASPARSPNAAPGILPGQTPGNASPLGQAPFENAVLPLTPPKLESIQIMPSPANQSLQPLHATPSPGIAPTQPGQALPPFPFPANSQQGNSFFSMNSGGSPFHPGPPPGAQSPGTPPPGLAPVGNSPFNTIQSSPSATTVFNLPGPGPFPGAGAPAGPGPLPPYLTGNTAPGYASVSYAQEKSLSHITKTILKRPPALARRRRQPVLLAGLVLNVLSLAFIGPWLLQIVPSYHDLTAAWFLIFALVGSITATLLFFNSGNKKLNCALSFILAIYWGFVGNALGNVTHGSFLFDPSILAFTFFLGSLALHLSFTFTRR